MKQGTGRKKGGLRPPVPAKVESLLVSGNEPAKTPSRIRKTGPAEITVKATRTIDELLADLCSLTGTVHNEVAIRIAGQVQMSLGQPKASNVDGSLIQAISTIAEIAPQNGIEAMLAAQMIATHEMALLCLSRVTLEGQTVEGAESNVLRATRLMRLHLEQIEAMQKLKGKAGQQKVTVEHVHVYQGGQAIVGAVSTGKTEPGGGVNERIRTNTP
jgi:hypothetical protein